jgi:ABC-type antimicrobial peptide transport system permease subunit
MALGAERKKVTAMILRGALVQVTLGLAIGVPIAWLSVRFVESQLYEIKGITVTVLLTWVLVLVIAASMAGLISARRAASIDPARALRTD